MNQDELILRELLWLNHGHQGLYGDDGEMQCSDCGIDFKRLLAAEIRDAFRSRTLAALVTASPLAPAGHICLAFKAGFDGGMYCTTCGAPIGL